MASKPIYEIYLELNDFEPKVWRRIQVSENITMNKLGYIIMVAFEMSAQHFYSFIIPDMDNSRNNLKSEKKSLPYIGAHNIQLEIINEFTDFVEENSKLVDARDMTLKNTLSNLGDKATFYYDYGDDWAINIKIENIFVDKNLNARTLPRVIDGEGFGIVENCGGSYGLTALVKAFELGEGEEYETFSEWLDIDFFDITLLDINDINFRLQKLPRVYANIYENQAYPSKQSIAIINRDYLD